MKNYLLTFLATILLAGSSCNVKTDTKSNGISTDTQETDSITDNRDGTTYKTVKIGDQWWMAENLKATKFNDGTVIPKITDNTAWSNLITPAYCWYDNNEATYGNSYGALYNWYTVNTGKLCPTGWHVPDREDWETLIDYLGGPQIAGGKLKERGDFHWKYPNYGATNETGFSALPGGDRKEDGTYVGVNKSGGWWSSSFEYPTGRPRYFRMGNENSGLLRWEINKEEGSSVRCLADTKSIPISNYVQEIDSITDNRDGITYKTVKIGDQWWMAENLKATKFNDGTVIPKIEEDTFDPDIISWPNMTTPAYCWYDNNEAAYGNTYGALYNWYTVNQGNLCPTGWHVPTVAEWTTLTDYLGGFKVAGSKLKETDTTHWRVPNTRATNESGFSALPGAGRDFLSGFGGIRNGGYWWSSDSTGYDSAWYLGMHSEYGSVIMEHGAKMDGLSVRCIRD